MPLRKKRDEKAMDKQHETIMAEESRPGQPSSEAMMNEYVSSLGRSVYTIIDPEINDLLEKHGLEFLKPMLSHLNRMTQEYKDDVILDKLDIEYIFLRTKCTMKEDEYTIEKAALLETLEYYAMHIPMDSFEGFKAKLLAYVVKLIKTEVEEKKTKGII